MGVEISGRFSDANTDRDRDWDLMLVNQDHESDTTDAIGVRRPIHVSTIGTFGTSEFAAGRYVLVGTSTEHRTDGRPGRLLGISQSVLVDTRSERAPGLVIEMHPMVGIVLRPTFANYLDCSCVLRMSSGLFVRGVMLSRDSLGFGVPAGSYELTLTRRNELIAKLPVTVGSSPVVVDLP
jgi:hypothetical protein